jgi:hypothetical protein
VRPVPDLTSDEWWVLYRAERACDAHEAFVVCGGFARPLVEAKLVRAYRIGIGIDVVVIVPTHRGRREVAAWRRRAVPDRWPG